MHITPELLHHQAFADPFGLEVRYELEAFLSEAANKFAAEQPAQPDFTVAIQSCDDTPEQVKRLFDDLEAQEYAGEVEKLFVTAHYPGQDQHRREAAIALAEERGAKVVGLAVGPSFRANMLNKGVLHAKNDTVASLAGHAALPHNMWAQMVGYHASHPDFGAAYGFALPDVNASRAERLGANILGAKDMVIEGDFAAKLRLKQDKPSTGLLAGDSSVVSAALVKELGYYPEKYGAGGADGALGKLMMEGGAEVTRSLGLANHHTHGFGIIAAVRQAGLWASYAVAHDFNPRASATWHPHRGL